MGLSKKFVMIFVVGSLPLLLMYQNCSKTQNFEMQDMTSLKADSSLPFDSGVLEPGQSAELGSGEQPINRYQVEENNTALGAPVEEENQSNSNSNSNSSSNPEALADCSAHMSESDNPNEGASFSNDSASGVQGKKVLSPEDFGGNRQIKSISNTGGHIILCNLEVESYSDSNGRVDLVNSHANFINHSGTVKVIGD